MKLYFPLACCTFFCQIAYTQVMGNYGQQQQTYQNINYNAQYRGVAKAAAFTGDNQLEISI
jgi:hypothetical protein